MAKHIGYVQIDGAPGESKDQGHNEWIKLLGVSENVSRPVATQGTTRSTDRATLGDVILTKLTDKASPKLYEFTCTGKSIAKITVDLVNSTGAGKEETFVKITMENVIISSFQLSSDLNNDSFVPTERVALNFTKIKFEYWPFDDKLGKGGLVDTSWNTETNAKN